MTRTPAFSSPLLLGFEDIERLLDRVSKNTDGYPPYNIERIAADGTEPARIRIALAVAGFGRDDIEVTVEENELTVRGSRTDAPSRDYLHRGGAAVPADFRAGGRYGGHRRGAEGRSLVDRPPAAGARAPGPEDSDHAARLKKWSRA